MNFNNKNIHIAATPTARVTNDNDDKDSNDDDKKVYLVTYRNLQENHDYFSRVHATLHLALSSVRPSVTFLKF